MGLQSIGVLQSIIQKMNRGSTGTCSMSKTYFKKVSLHTIQFAIIKHENNLH